MQIKRVTEIETVDAFTMESNRITQLLLRVGQNVFAAFKRFFTNADGILNIFQTLILIYSQGIISGTLKHEYITHTRLFLRVSSLLQQPFSHRHTLHLI